MKLPSRLVAVATALVAVTPVYAGERVEKPQSIDFSKGLDATMEALEGQCVSQDVREFHPPQIPLAKESHAQVDCQGFDFMGEPRLAEFVFADDALMLVWVLVDDDDETRVIAAMREAYASEGLDVGAALAFPDKRTAYRFEPAEVLFYSEAAAPMFEARFLRK